jgi:hypothetical protein
MDSQQRNEPGQELGAENSTPDYVQTPVSSSGEPWPQPAPVEALPTPKHNPKKSKVVLLILLVVLLLVGAAATYYFVVAKKDKSPANNGKTPPTSQKPVPSAASGVAYLSYSTPIGGQGQTDYTLHYAAFDLTKKTSTDLWHHDGLAYILGGRMVNGKNRVFVEVPGSTDKDVTKVYYQDDNGTPKEIYSEAASAGSSYTYILWPRNSIAADGSSIDDYEYGTSEPAYKRVGIDGKVTTLIADMTKQMQKDLPGYTGKLIPEDQSKDGKTIYFQSVSCLNCDGGSYTDIVAYDVAAAKLHKLYTHDGGPQEGSWRMVGDGKFVITASDQGGVGNSPSYEEVSADPMSISTFDAATGKLTTIFTSKAPETASAAVIGNSSDNKFAYISVSKIIKLSTLANDKDPSGGHVYDAEITEIRAYDLATGKYQTVSLPVDYTKLGVNDLYSNDTSYLYTTSAVHHFDDKTNDNTNVAYVLDKTTGAKATSLVSDKNNIISFFGFGGK